MRRSGSLRRRVALALTAGMTAIWLLATAGAGYFIQAEITEAFDTGLQETVRRVLPLVARDTGHADHATPTNGQSPLQGPAGRIVYAVFDAEGRMIQMAADADPAVFPAAPETGFHQTDDYRFYGWRTDDGSVFIEVGEPLALRREDVSEALFALLLPVALIAPLSLLGVWLLVSGSLRPLDRFRADIETRGQGDLSAIATEKLPAEIAPVGEAVNRLMERIKRVLEAERNFAANTAHELRTPIAASLAQAQRLIAETTDEPSRRRARQIETALHNLSDTSEKLMQLARAESGALIAETASPLAPVTALVIDAFAQPPERLRLTLPGGEGPSSRIDPDAYAILLRNLVENALKHGDPGSVVEVILDERTLRVINDGPLISAQDLARLKRRFERGGAQMGGAGLGLAIVETIAAGMGAELRIGSPARGRPRGFEAWLILPE